jgi:hypothetical protein
MENFNYIRGGLNTDRENGTYCCIELINKTIGYSNVDRAFGKDTEISAINSAIKTLQEIIIELENEKNKLNL